jgi:hypothetical protein
MVAWSGSTRNHRGLRQSAFLNAHGRILALERSAAASLRRTRLFTPLASGDRISV